MRIGILKTGHLPPDLESLLPSYPAMIRAALGPAYRYEEFDAEQSILPQHANAADAYVITGSASSVYEDEAWIGGLRDWLKELDPATPVVGICFGHQLMAEAYGGKVEKSSEGWALGLQECGVRAREPWMDDVSRFVIPVAHHDQVIAAPPTSRVIAASDSCPYAALIYQDRYALSFQGHPEFDLDFAALVIDRCEQKGAIAAAQAEAARASLQTANDRQRVIGWIRRFLEHSRTVKDVDDPR